VTRVRNFIEIGSYLTGTEQKISWYFFVETLCNYNCVDKTVDDRCI